MSSIGAVLDKVGSRCTFGVLRSRFFSILGSSASSSSVSITLLIKFSMWHQIQRLLATGAAFRLFSIEGADREVIGSTMEEARVVLVGPRTWRVLREERGSG